MLVSAVCQHKSAISIHIFFPSWTSSHLPTHPPPLGCHRAPGWTSCVIQQLPRLAIYFTHGSVYMSLLLSQFIPPSPSPVLQIGSSVPFSRLHIYALICDICFSLSDFLLPVQQVLGSSTTLQWTQIHSFLWLIFHCIYVPVFCVCAQSCLTPCNPVNCTPPGSSVHEIFQARILEWVPISYSRGSSWPRDWTHTSCVSSIAGRVFYQWAIRKPYICTTAYLSIHLSVNI